MARLGKVKPEAGNGFPWLFFSMVCNEGNISRIFLDFQTYHGLCTQELVRIKHTRKVKKALLNFV